MELTKNSCVWDFVMKYYPDYKGSVENIRLNNLEFILEDKYKIGDVAHKIFVNECESNLEIVKVLCEECDCKILEQAISNYCKTINIFLWDFIKIYYPDYHLASNLALKDIFEEIQNDDIVNISIIQDMIKSEIKNIPKYEIKSMVNNTLHEIYFNAITNFIKLGENVSEQYDLPSLINIKFSIMLGDLLQFI
jgi:hypothetical protein